MKKSILIIFAVLTTLSLAAYSFINANIPDTDKIETAVNKDIANKAPVEEKVKNTRFSDFIYAVGPRFGPIKKRDLENVNFFEAYIGEEHANRIVSYKSLSVIILDGDKKTDIRETGYSGQLNAAQIELLQSLPYSSNLMIWADYLGKNKETGELEDTHWTPYLTIVPEKQAEYLGGKEALMDYLKFYIKEYTDKVKADELQPAKLFFTVTKKGVVENVKLDRTSNFPEIDDKMIELITKAPGTWDPAENSKGEKVDQELVISFGLKGC